ncbi:hypothetical protein G7Y79_00019g046490 [Physcia stellaris]|nr:hypothetical protein G7Y79_00019g046490 [Physcia stellaris]
MARRYNRDELLRLRESPLVSKPANLPPTEEWMGPKPDPDHNQKKAPIRRSEDLSLNDPNMIRRPPFESRISRNNAPEDIVLGPPKTAFASAAGPRSSRTFDSPNRGNFLDDEAKADRSQLKDRFKDTSRRDRDTQKSMDDKPENVRNRENDRWGNARQPRTPFGEGDRDFRRNGDRDQGRDKNNGRDMRGDRGFDNLRRNGDRDGNGEERRYGQGRGRNEPSWYRDDDRQVDEESKGAPKQDWRDKVAGRGHDRDRSMGGNQEKEPEWLDEPDDKKQAHTLDEFQRWKEKMKASNAPASETPTSADPGPKHERTFSGTASKKVETPLVVDSSFDAFFGMFGDKKTDTSTPGEEAAKRAYGKPSKFTGFFGPKVETKAQEPPTPAAPPPDPAKDRSSEDKEGFQRILKLLDQQQSTSSRNMTPFREQTPRNLPQSPPPQPPQRRESNPRDTSMGSRAPKESPAFPSRDSEFLLNLMKQPKQPQPTRTPRTQPSLEEYNPSQSSLAAFSNLMISPHDTPQQTPSTGPPPGFFDHSYQIDHLQQREKPQQVPQRQQPKPPAPPGLFDSLNLSKFFPDEHSLPPGLQRAPPGLDQHQQQMAQNFAAPPSQRQQQQQQPQYQVQPPPGFPHLPSLNTHQHQAAFPHGPMPGLTSPHHAQPSSNQDRGQQQQQQQYGGRPPPGFAAMGNPQFQAPPGFGAPGMYGALGQDGFPPFGEYGGGQGQGQGGHYGR